MIANTISPFEELVAYETLWANSRDTIKKLKAIFLDNNALPSVMLKEKQDIYYNDISQKVREFLKSKKGFSVCLKGDFQYPAKLMDAKYPLELLYYKGDINLMKTKCVSVVGTRHPSTDGINNAIKVVKLLAKEGLTVVSGLAAGIDTHALNSALDSNGKVIGVIGTPIDKYYPKENICLQDRIANSQLLVSQVPFFRYEHEPFGNKKFYFPERNVTMSAMSEATVIIEASETSGTRIQAKACVDQKRKLILMKSIIADKRLTWPKRYVDQGAYVANDANDVLDIIKS